MRLDNNLIIPDITVFLDMTQPRHIIKSWHDLMCHKNYYNSIYLIDGMEDKYLIFDLVDNKQHTIYRYEYDGSLEPYFPTVTQSLKYILDNNIKYKRGESCIEISRAELHKIRMAMEMSR